MVLPMDNGAFSVVQICTPRFRTYIASHLSCFAFFKSLVENHGPFRFYHALDHPVTFNHSTAFITKYQLYFILNCFG